MTQSRPLPAVGRGPSWLDHAGQVGLAAAMAVVLLPTGLQATRDGELAPSWKLALAGALVAMHICVGTARLWSVPSFVVGALACGILVAAPDIAGATAVVDTTDYGPILLPSTLCFFPLLYAVSAHAETPWPNTALGVGLAGGGLSLARLWGFTGAPINDWAWWLMLSTAAVGGCVAAWALGRYRATRIAWSAQLADRVAADERRRIAREMHDVVAHSLAVVVSHAEAGRLVVPNAPERASEILTTIAEAGREALSEMRGLLGVLRDDDAPTAPQPGLADLPSLIERMRAAGVEVEFTIRAERRVNPAVELTVYRVVQEALTNVARHAGHRPSARVLIEAVTSELVVTVTNTSALRAGAPGWGRGLIGMRERVEAVGGTLEAGSVEAGSVEGGWRVSARMSP